MSELDFFTFIESRLPGKLNKPMHGKERAEFWSKVAILITKEMNGRIKELERQLEEAKAELSEPGSRWKRYREQRDAALDQVVALRCLVDDFFNYVGGADDPRQDGYLMDRAVDALMDTSATAQQTVERIEREALEKAVDRVDMYVNKLHPPMGRAAAPLRAAILGKKES